jgi:hypothetical protein
MAVGTCRAPPSTLLLQNGCAILMRAWISWSQDRSVIAGIIRKAWSGCMNPAQNLLQYSIRNATGRRVSMNSRMNGRWWPAAPKPRRRAAQRPPWKADPGSLRMLRVRAEAPHYG